MNVRMILTDLDGTLIRSDGSISERTKEILKSCRSRGIYVVIATAWYWIGAEHYIEKICCQKVNLYNPKIDTKYNTTHNGGRRYLQCRNGETVEMAVTNALDEKKAWIEAALEEGIQIQEPDSLEDYSGQFKLRIPRSLHRLLAEHSKREGISMNQYCVYLLSRNDAVYMK